MEETMNITYPEKEVEQMIRNYFGDSLKKLEVNMYGRMAIVDIVYENFKSRRIVRRELEDKIPNIDIEQLYRNYSDNVLLRTLEELMEEGRDIFIKEDDGNLRKTNIACYFDEVLQFRNF